MVKRNLNTSIKVRFSYHNKNILFVRIAGYLNKQKSSAGSGSEEQNPNSNSTSYSFTNDHKFRKSYQLNKSVQIYTKMKNPNKRKVIFK